MINYHSSLLTVFVDGINHTQKFAVPYKKINNNNNNTNNNKKNSSKKKTRSKSVLCF